MAHQVLQTFDIQHRLLCIGAEGMPQDMGRHAGKRVPVLLDILPLHSAHVFLQMHGNLWLTFFIQKQEAAVSIHHHLDLGMSTTLQNTAESHIDGIRHGNATVAAAGLWRGYEIGLVRRAAQLLMDVDTPSVKVDVCLGQTIEFTDTQPSS